MEMEPANGRRSGRAGAKIRTDEVHNVSDAKLLITGTATAIVKSPIGRLGIRRIALGSPRRLRAANGERTDVTINKNDAMNM